MTDHELLLKILEKVEGIEKDVKALDAKVDRRFDDITKTVGEAVDVIVEKIDQIETVTARNCYRLEILDSKQKAE